MGGKKSPKTRQKNKQKTQPRPMNRFEISLGPVSPADTTPESTCKQGQGQEEGGPEETSATHCR